jgi:ribonuclease R
MVSIRDLGHDYYDFDEKNFVIVGRRHHITYQLGDPIRIQVARADLERKQLAFVLADD